MEDKTYWFLPAPPTHALVSYTFGYLTKSYDINEALHKLPEAEEQASQNSTCCCCSCENWSLEPMHTQNVHNQSIGSI